MTLSPRNTAEVIRRTVHFSGRVQGVGFRYTTESIARRFAVTGYVRNLPDGRVELVTEGTVGELDRFVGAISEAMRSNISEVATSNSAANGEFDVFGIMR